VGGGGAAFGVSAPSPVKMLPSIAEMMDAAAATGSTGMAIASCEQQINKSEQIRVS